MVANIADDLFFQPEWIDKDTSIGNKRSGGAAFVAAAKLFEVDK